MAIVHQFSYARPSNLDEALALMDRHAAAAAILAGGTDLVVNLKEGRARPSIVVDIKGITELQRLHVADGKLEIGALATFSDLLRAESVRTDFPLIAESAGTVASVGIRNRATLVGNLCSAVPSLDCGPALLVHDAQVHVVSIHGSRAISIHEWFTGPKITALQPGELVVSVSIPRPIKPHASCYMKLGRYRGEDLAQAGIAVMAVDGFTYRIAHSALAPAARRARFVESILDGAVLDQGVLRLATAALAREIAPITDMRATAAYRRHLAGVMLERGLREAVRRLHARGPVALGRLP
ncbi:MAG: xanthine dehydrogenase family protein subunit M [Candidatus Eisenbacteria bacterium]|jgi:carbon-monoxide dehydrogenase medium subunit|nr:xanthine dehydrogenase family protein subunit M [Candidatus Eisenbacteria bacterium]